MVCHYHKLQIMDHLAFQSYPPYKEIQLCKLSKQQVSRQGRIQMMMNLRATQEPLKTKILLRSDVLEGSNILPAFAQWFITSFRSQHFASFCAMVHYILSFFIPFISSCKISWQLMNLFIPYNQICAVKIKTVSAGHRTLIKNLYNQKLGFSSSKLPSHFYYRSFSKFNLSNMTLRVITFHSYICNVFPPGPELVSVPSIHFRYIPIS